MRKYTEGLLCRNEESIMKLNYENLKLPFKLANVCKDYQAFRDLLSLIKEKNTSYYCY